MPDPNQPQAERDFWLSDEEKQKRAEHDAKFKELFDQLPKKKSTLFDKEPTP